MGRRDKEINHIGGYRWNTNLCNVILFVQDGGVSAVFVFTPICTPVFDAGGYPAPVFDGGGYPAPVFDGGGYPAPVFDAGGYPAPVFDGGGYPAPVFDAGGYPAPVFDAGGYTATESATIDCNGTRNLQDLSTAK